MRLEAERGILFLDEGTAHLDVENEININDALKRLQMTRISVAHRPQISRGASRMLRIAKTLKCDARGPAPDAIANQRDKMMSS
jgi:ATP-binding cassette, subfamily B, bacterial CvaB/MchF/RaxB